MKTFQHIYESINKNKFVRYGRIDKWAKQRNHVNNKKTDMDGKPDTEITYHTAPTSRGFYAMPHGYEESFLIGSLNATQPDLFPTDYAKDIYDENPFYKYENDPSWKQPQEEQDRREKEMEAYSKKLRKAEKNVYSKNRKIFTLRDQDLIWHHLENKTPLNEIEKRSGSWIQTTVKTFFKALKRSLISPEGYPYSRDHLEVFCGPEISI